MNNKKCVIMDVDGTLANAEHRIHLLPKKNEKDTDKVSDAWNDFFAAAVNDTPNEEIIALNNAMKDAGYTIFAVTGRKSSDMTMTEKWLDDNGIKTDGLLMRNSDDFRPDTVVKSEILDMILEWGYEVVFCVEDRAGVTKMWRERGLRCLQVCEGDY